SIDILSLSLRQGHLFSAAGVTSGGKPSRRADPERKGGQVRARFQPEMVLESRVQPQSWRAGMSATLRPLWLLTIVGLLVLSGANSAARQSKAVEYRIGPDDVLSVRLFDQDPKYSSDVTVRPDGKITLALIDDIDAGGLTPMQLKATLT